MSTTLRVVGENFVPPGREPSDEAIDRIQELVAKQAGHEAALWGSQKGEGLVTTIQHLSKSTSDSIQRVNETVAQLASTVALLAGRVTGEDGLAVQLRDVKLELKAMNERREQDAKDLSVEQAKMHATNQERINRLWQVGTPVIVFIVIALLGLIGRSAFVMTHGVQLAR